MISDLKKAAQGYPAWKNQQSNFRKPWRFPDQITAQRVSVFDVSILLSPLDENLTSFEISNSIVFKRHKCFQKVFKRMAVQTISSSKEEDANAINYPLKQ